jgi:hypothetical protein
MVGDEVALDPFRRGRLGALVACWLLSLAVAATSRAGTLAVAPAQADPSLAPIALGFDRWLESSLRSNGRDVVSIPAAGVSGLAAAAQRGATQALLPRLVGNDSRVELRLSVYEAATGDLVASSRAEAPLDELGRACSARSRRSRRRSASAPTRRRRT